MSQLICPLRTQPPTYNLPLHNRKILRQSFKVVVAAHRPLQLGLLDVSSEVEGGANTREVVETWRRGVVRRLAVDEERVAVRRHGQRSG